jgi:hypothetical protein
MTEILAFAGSLSLVEQQIIIGAVPVIIGLWFFLKAFRR